MTTATRDEEPDETAGPTGDGRADGTGTFESHRPRLFALAYRMLGSAADAEDAVQDAWIRYSGADRAAIEEPAAWLTKVVTNLCLTRLTSARARRERYTGTWLPEPVLTSGGALGPIESAEQREAVSIALLLLLERLTPVERAVYVLREAFAYSHREIAGLLDLSEANSRQLHRRAAARVNAPGSRFEPDPVRQQELVTSFLAASREGDLAGLEKLLAEDATWWSDGGGRVRAAIRPVRGRAKVLRFLQGVRERFTPDVEYALAEVNGAPAMLTLRDGTLINVVAFEVRDGLITGMRSVLNPDKLGYAQAQLDGTGPGTEPARRG